MLLSRVSLAPMLLLALAAASPVLARPPWMDTALSPAARAQALLAQMTTAEKISMLHGPATGDCCECATDPLCNYTGAGAQAPFVRGALLNG